MVAGRTVIAQHRAEISLALWGLRSHDQIYARESRAKRLGVQVEAKFTVGSAS